METVFFSSLGLACQSVFHLNMYISSFKIHNKCMLRKKLSFIYFLCGFLSLVHELIAVVNFIILVEMNQSLFENETTEQECYLKR